MVYAIFEIFKMRELTRAICLEGILISVAESLCIIILKQFVTESNLVRTYFKCVFKVCHQKCRNDASLI